MVEFSEKRRQEQEKKKKKNFFTTLRDRSGSASPKEKPTAMDLVCCKHYNKKTVYEKIKIQ